MHYVIIATKHTLQTADSVDKGLEKKLAAIIRRGGVVLIAEEVDANSDVITFGRELSRQLIGEDRWLSVDMTDGQRRDAGIYEELSRRSNPEFDAEARPFNVNRYFRRADGIRENHWLDRIEEKCQFLGATEGTVLITCGCNHGPFLREKAIGRGHVVKLRECGTDDCEAVHGKLKICD